jgi:hypothetical protein
MGDDVTRKPQTFLQSIGQRYADEKLRAQIRLKTYGRDEWNFAIVGLDCDLNVIELEGLATLRKVVEPPGEIFLAGALENPTAFGAIGRYASQIKYELAVSRNFAGDDFQAVWNFAWWLISGLRVKTLAELRLCWAVISANTLQEMQTAIKAYNFTRQMMTAPQTLYQPFISLYTWEAAINTSANTYNNTSSWTNYAPLHIALPDESEGYEWKRETGEVQSYQHTETAGWLHIDPQGQFYDRHAQPIERDHALEHAAHVGLGNNEVSQSPAIGKDPVGTDQGLSL